MSVTLAHSEYGAGEPLLILHGLFGSAKNWHSLAKRLGVDYHVYALDLRNHGRSPWADSMHYADLAADVELFMQEQGLSQAMLLGHSMGGKTAMYLALHAPQLVSRLIVADIAPVSYTHSFMPYIEAMQAVDFSRVQQRSEVDAVLSIAVPEIGTRQFLLQNLVLEDGQLRWRLHLRALAANMSILLNFPSTQQIFNAPTLFMAGAKSDYIQPHHYALLHQHFPQAQISTLENAGHWLHAEQPAAFLQVAHAFLANGRVE